jgi:beta-galactosidase
MTELAFRDGVAHIDGSPVFLVTAEYPYYRDDPAQWRAKLEGLRALGVLAVTSYVPWRHHELASGSGRRFDFVGRTQLNRDVRGFLALCAELGLAVILKPGPFCHAELNYGGLPDFVCPLQRSDIPSARDAEGAPVTWNGATLGVDGRVVRWPLPSFFAPAFAAEAARWLETVAREVIRPASSASGPVVAVQVGNEGVVCDAQHPVWADDFSAPALAAFQGWLRGRYDDLGAYNARHGTAWRRWRDVRPPRRWTAQPELRNLECYREWSEFLGHALGEFLAGYARILAVPIPALASVNPPTADPWGTDAWLSRVRPAGWDGLQYGFTNWIGVAADDPSVVARYELMAGIAPGPNLEENWGFTAYYGPAYGYPVVSFHQTVAMVAAGATGYNLYTGAGTDRWDARLDCFNSRPYPASAPIDETGLASAPAGVAALLNRFLALHGAELIACRARVSVRWAIDRRASWLAAWITGAEEPRADGHRLCASGPILAALQHRLSELGHGLGFVDLETATLADLARAPLVVVASGPVMDLPTQRLLAEYATGGGRLLVVGDLPRFDTELYPCAVLAAASPLVVLDAEAMCARLLDLLDPTMAVEARGGRAWLRLHPDRDVQYLIALSDGATDLEIRYPDRGSLCHVSLRVAGGGGALLRIEAGEPTVVLLKGIDERAARSVAPTCAVGRVELVARDPGDLLATWSEGRWSAWAPLVAGVATADSHLAPTTRFTVSTQAERGS